MDNNQQVDITADLTDERLVSAAADALNKYLKTNLQIASNQACRAVAAMAREGWRPIPQDEGFPMTLHQPRSNPCRLVVPAAEGEAQQLAEQLHELASILESLQIPQWPGRVLRAAELLVRKQAPAPASERPWECEGWLHPQGQWCWHWNRGAAGWDHRTLVNDVEDDTFLLPHWAIPAPGSPDW